MPAHVSDLRVPTSRMVESPGSPRLSQLERVEPNGSEGQGWGMISVQVWSEGDQHEPFKNATTDPEEMALTTTEGSYLPRQLHPRHRLPPG